MSHNMSPKGKFGSLLAVLIASMAASACSTTPAPDTNYAGDPINGQRMAQDLCAACHAVGATGDSPRADAPPLHTVLAGYPADQLTADLQSAKHIAFLRMPQFHLGDNGGADLVAYIESLQDE